MHLAVENVNPDDINVVLVSSNVLITTFTAGYPIVPSIPNDNVKTIAGNAWAE